MRTLVFVVLAGVWAAIAYSLWQTRVPDGLDLPVVDLAGRIDPDVIARSKRYERFFRIEFVVSQLVLLGVLLAYARWGIRFARESAAGRIGTGMMLGMIGLALVWISQVPFRLAEVWWDRRYDQTDAGYIETLFANWFQLGAEFLFISFALAIVMALAGRFPRRWWIARRAGLRRARGPLRLHLPLPLRHRAARPSRARGGRARLRAASRESSRSASASRTSRTSRARRTPTRPASDRRKRIVFWNTMLDGRFTDDEVKVVLAHELAHHSRTHITESLTWYALFALPGAWLIAVATRRRGGMANPAAVPLSLLVIVVLNLVSLPVYNVLSRHMEQEADWVALETTRDPDSAGGLFENFTIESLNDPSPPTWSYLLFDSHPSVEKRIAMAEAWRNRSR